MPDEAKPTTAAAPDSGSPTVRRLLLALVAWSFLLRAVFAASGLEPGRFYDERYTLANVEALLLAEADWPANAFYPSLAYLPQTVLLAGAEALHRRTGVSALAVFTPGGETFSPFAYYLCRLVQAVYGTLSILFTFLVGRRLFAPSTALLGAFLLAVVPDHLRLSVFFKPDILLTWLVLVVFLWSLEAARRPEARPLLRVGLGVGLATAAKYTGAVTALPLTLELALSSWREHRWALHRWFLRRPDRRRWLGLAAAGLLAVAVFAALNPDLRQVLTDYGRVSRAYTRNAPPLAGGRLGMLWAEAGILWGNHGFAVGLAAFAGLALLAFRTFGKPRGSRAGDDSPTQAVAQIGRRMLLTWVAGFSLLYAAVTELPKANNYLPLLPFTSLAAAWALMGLWRLLGRSFPYLGHRQGAAVIAAYFSIFLAWPLHTWVYDVTVPRTHALAEEDVARRLDLLPNRWVFWEREVALEAETVPSAAVENREEEHPEVLEKHRPEVLIQLGRHRAAVDVVNHLLAVGHDDLDLADAESFPAARLEEGYGAFYVERVRRAGGRAEIPPPGKLSRGAPRVVLTHPWRLLADPRRLPVRPVPGREGSFEAVLPVDAATGTAAETAFTLHVGLPPEAWSPRLALGERPLPLRRQRSQRRRSWFHTPRFRPPPEGTVVHLSHLPPELTAEDVQLEAVPWAAPAPAPDAENGR